MQNNRHQFNQHKNSPSRQALYAIFVLGLPIMVLWTHAIGCDSDIDPVYSDHKSGIILNRSDATQFEKNGVKMRAYTTPADYNQAAIVYQETETGHFEEFYHSRSHFIYYIIEGRGTYYINETAHNVGAGDVVIIPPGVKFYYTGSLKQVCVTSPAWDAEHEHHVRNVSLE